MEKIVVGVDIAGSHVTAELIDLVKKEKVNDTWVRDRLDSHASADEIIDAWARTIEKSIQKHPVAPEKINIAIPGPMDYKNGILKIKDQDKYRSLYNLNIKEMLAKRLGFDADKINFNNDAACFLKGELFTGSLSGFEKAIGLTLGTGLGTSHVSNGKTHDSNLWKMPFNKGIAEDYISTRWFIKRFYELTGVTVKDVQDLVENHQESPYFKTIFAEFSENLASFIYKFIRKKMPLAAVIGGNIANAEQYFIEDTRKILADKMGYSFPLKKSTLGDRATLFGAGASL